MRETSGRRGRGRHTVASGHPVTTAAAVQTLGAGGNAFDAVVAAGLTAAVVEPVLASIAGGGFCLAHTAAGDTSIVDFFVDVPGRGQRAEPASMTTIEVAFSAATQEFHVGWPSVAVPGCLAGWLHLHATRGRLPLVDVVAPAETAAADGVVVNAQQAYLFQLTAPIAARVDEVADRYLPGGVPLPEGAVLVQTDVADFLRELGRDPRGARERFETSLVEGVVAGGGAVTTADLAAYEVRERPPLRADYRGLTVVTNDVPGGRLIARQLTALADGPPLEGWNDPEGPRRIIDAQREADRHREAAATQGTTQVTVADADGNVASMTVSNGTGSGCPIPGLGILCNNMLGEDDLFPGGLGTGVPGERVQSMMAPSMVLDGDDVVLAVGSGGSKRIRTALSQVIARVIDHEPDLQRAVAGPRVHHDGDLVQLEPGFSADARARLADGYPVNAWGHTDLYFGGVHAVIPGEQAAGDPRRGGSSAVV